MAQQSQSLTLTKKSANAIATVVGTKVLTPRQAILLAAVTNLLGAFFGLAVAKTISGGLVDPSAVTMTTVLAALLAAIIWNLFTWWKGLPSSSSHALVFSMVGAGVAAGSPASSRTVPDTWKAPMTTSRRSP